jgi:hypothetical protein
MKLLPTCHQSSTIVRATCARNKSGEPARSALRLCASALFRVSSRFTFPAM